MKRFAALILAAAIGMAATGCGENAEQPGNISQSTPDLDIDSNLSDISGAITVSCFEPMPTLTFLEEAAALFEAKYPGTKVTVTAFSAMPEIKTSSSGGKTISIITKDGDSAAEQADYINKTNTELMGGGGADVLAIDVLPYYKYAESGQLEDLNSYMRADSSFNMNDYSENIFKGTSYKGGQYLFPLDYSFDYIAYDSSLFSEAEQQPLLDDGTLTYEQLVAIGQEPFINAGEQTKMFGMSAKQMFNQLFKENYAYFIDYDTKTANFDDGEFAQLLETSASYAGNGYIQQGEPEKGAEMSMDSFEKIRDEHYFYKVKNARGLLQHFNKNSGRMMMYGGTAGGSGNEDNDEIAGLIAGKNKTVAYTCRQAYGINSNSQNKATAWAFIKFLSENEMQTSLNLMGMPVNIGARAERTKQEINGELYAARLADMGETIDETSFELTDEQKGIYDTYMDALDKYTDMLGVCLIEDTTIANMISAEADSFFSGQKTSSEVAQTLQNKVQLYFDE